MKKFAVFLFVIVIVGANLFLQGLILPKESNVKAKTETKEDMPIVGSYENLKKILKQAEKTREVMYGRMEATMAFDQGLANTGAAKSSADVSQTNVQVAGVDEADLIKTDGRFLYQVNNEEVVIAQVYPTEDMKVIKRLNYKGLDFTPFDLYVDDKHLIVIGNKFRHQPMPEEKEPASGEGSDIVTDRAMPEIYPPIRGAQTVKVIIYDISNIEKITELRDFEIEGHYISSRKIGSSLYLVANKHVDYYYIMEDSQDAAEQATPAYRDSLSGEDFVNIDYSKISYFPESEEPNYLMVAGLDLADLKAELKVNTYLGSGQNIYASKDNLYVAVAQYEAVKEESKAQSSTAQSSTDETSQKVDPNQPVDVSILPLPQPLKVNTLVYKFGLKAGNVEYKSKGKVPGQVLNQFSMDENKGHFRIATTIDQMWGNNQDTSKNNLYVLDGAMEIVGKIENIAPGERIYSVRFMGARAYMVTFKTVDPLFVIDVGNPKAPKILGELKIPGYSDYLHPYDENHIIGFGKDAVEAEIGEGENTQKIALNQGFKMALFDVSDVKNPKEKYKVGIGGRGTESELLYNHKALLFSKEKDILAFPITVREQQGNASKDIFEYGKISFQGAYIFGLDLSKGFMLKGKLSQIGSISSEEQVWQSNKTIERLIYIGDNLYTISKGQIVAHDISTLKELNKLQLAK